MRKLEEKKEAAGAIGWPGGERSRRQEAKDLWLKLDAFSLI